MRNIATLRALPSVTSRQTAEAFIRELSRLGLSYHFEDGAYDCLFENGQVTQDDAAFIDAAIDACYAHWESSDCFDEDCPIAFSINCDEHQERGA